MSAEALSSGMRQVLTAPRGHRFTRTRTRTGTGTRTKAPPPTHEQRLLAQMEGNPRLAHRQSHGELPPWMALHAARLSDRDRQNPDNPRTPAPDRQPAPAIPHPRRAPDDGPPPRPKPPPLPRRPRSHRKPRRKLRWTRILRTLTGYTLAATAGALAHHLATTLL